jgi:spermidine dehydrogenase
MARERSEDERLGMFRPITRRDFLQGTALALAVPGLARGQSARIPPSGFQGQDDPSMARGHRVRDGLFEEGPGNAAATGETYDLVVIGAGLSGLAAAYVFQRERKGRAKILLLENNDDFGGHARRNTFEWNGTTLIVNGGTYALEEPEHSPPGARQILDGLGIDPARMAEFRDPDHRKRFGLSSSAFFDPRVYPGIAPQFVHGFHEIPWEQFFAKAPLSDAARRELVTLYTTRKNYLEGEKEPMKALASMTWESYIRDRMGLGDEAVRFSNLYATDLGGLGCDALPATKGWGLGPGFFGVGGEGCVDDDGFLRCGYEAPYRFPDGNHSLARHLIKKLMPEALEGEDTMEGVFNGSLHYDRLDRPDSPVRLRLRSTAVRVEHVDGASRVRVSYAGENDAVRSVTARSAIVAAWGMASKHIVPELQEEQRSALGEYHYASALYINVMLRHWRPIAEAGAFEMYLPGGYAAYMHPLDPLHVGSYRPEHHPDKPTVLTVFKYPHKPGHPAETQTKLVRYELEAKPFEDFEREVRSELNHILGPWGFDAAQDILALTVNRWGHGYNVFPKPDLDSPAYERGRERIGRISFAGSDAGGQAWTQAGFEQGHRAALEQVGAS